MKEKVAFIGSGNMGGALITAACQALDPKQITITDYMKEKAQTLAGELGCAYAASNTEAVLSADYIFLCVKPQVMSSVLKEIAPVIQNCLDKGDTKVLVSIAAGLQIHTIREQLEISAEKLPIIRVMPNTSAAIGKGMLAVSAGAEVERTYVNGVLEILSKAGRTEVIAENLMDQFTVVSGCAPAFVYLFIEALADGAVMTGLPRAQAMTYAAQTVMGAASMVLETGKHPGELKDAVCSPAGSTIAGVAQLEEHGFRAAVIDAVCAGYERNKELGKTK